MNPAKPKYADELAAYLRWLADEVDNLAITKHKGDDAELRRLGGKAQGLRLAADLADSTVARDPCTWGRS